MGKRLDFEWDENKRRINLEKHGFDFRDCALLFRGPVASWLDVRFDYGEPRFLAAGLLNGRVVIVAYAEKPNAIRIISMRKASRNEETYYFESLARIRN